MCVCVCDQGDIYQCDYITLQGMYAYAGKCVCRPEDKREKKNSK